MRHAICLFNASLSANKISLNSTKHMRDYFQKKIFLMFHFFQKFINILKQTLHRNQNAVGLFMADL